MKARFADIGGTVFAGSPTDCSQFIADETAKWAKVIAFAGIKPSWSADHVRYEVIHVARDQGTRAQKFANAPCA
jgi:hypothetical protein